MGAHVLKIITIQMEHLPFQGDVTNFIPIGVGPT